MLFLAFGCFPFFFPFEALTFEFEFPKLSKEESVLRDDVEELLLGGVESSFTYDWAPFVLKRPGFPSLDSLLWTCLLATPFSPTVVFEEFKTFALSFDILLEGFFYIIQILQLQYEGI